MAKFSFKAKDQNGRLVEGVIDAKNVAELRTVLRSQNLTPVSAKQQSEFLYLGNGGVSSKDLQVFSRQFAVLIESGVPIIESLQSIEEGASNKKLKQTVKDIIRQISTGRNLSDGFSSYPRIFDRLYTNLVRAGEQSGLLDTVLNRLATYIEKSNKLRAKITGALWYPAVTMLIAIGAVAVILIFVIPKFKELFEGQNKELPALTEFVVNLSEAVKAHWYIGFGVLVAVPLALVIYYRTPSGRMAIDKVLIRLPIFGGLIVKSSIARMARTLSTLLSAGIRLTEAVEIASSVTGNAVIERDLALSKESIVQGRSFAEPLRKSKSIPLMVSQMINIGEQTGKMDVMLEKIADFYESEVETTADNLTSLIEPLLIVFLGGIVGFLVISMFLPIFNLAGTVAG